MKITELFRQMAGRGEAKLNDLVDQQTSNLDRQRALDRVEERFGAMASDGIIDESEMDELLQMMRNNGLNADDIEKVFEDLKGEDSSVRMDDADKLKFLIDTRIDNAQDNATTQHADLNFEVQIALADYTHGIESASAIQKQGHDADMAVIRNMVG